WSSETWREYLNCGENETELRGLRKCTHSGRPLGSQDFVHSLEQATSRRLEPQKGGRPRTAGLPQGQAELPI
ncbi:MAG: hypothetical protein WA853_02105, partial [Candidatus Acidiferrum sp.]